MAFRSIAANTTPSTSLSVSAPSGIANGDVLIAWAQSDDSGTTLSFPAGFTKLTGSPLVSTRDGMTLEAAYKVAASESGTYAFSSSQQVIGGVGCWTGIDTTTVPYRQSNGQNSTGNGSPWSITSGAFGSNTDAECDLVFIGGSDCLFTAVHTGPTGYTVVSDLTSGILATALAYQDAVASGVTGVATMTGTHAGDEAGWGCFHVALKTSGSAATLEQEGFRWYNDDGSESASTAAASQDTSITAAAGATKRLRMLVNATGDPATKAYKLQYRIAAGSWADVL